MLTTGTEATCSDGETNQGESDTDCGGPCSDCEAGDMCGSGDDCVSGVCSTGTCRKYLIENFTGSSSSNVISKPEPTCSDGRKNNGESDIDCGGFNCLPCEETKTCDENTDCYGDCEGSVCGKDLFITSSEAKRELIRR